MKQQKLCLAVRHLQFEDLGSFAAVLTQAGYQIRYLDAALEPLDDAFDADLCILLGGPVGVYDAALYPFLNTELAIVRHRLAAGLPLLGICLGAQLIASATGGRVYPGTAGKEIGWAPVRLTKAAASSGLFHGLVAPEYPMFHWHGDTFDLPPGAELLAETVAYRQIFRLGPQVLALQCHPELEAHRLEQWLLGHASELAGWGQADLPSLRADTAEHGAALRAFAQQLLHNWLAQLPGTQQS
ncbi:glutamine amidotransferase [Rheinheimera texasensis]|uniref:glutamine amidotransferase n=1 Tax=Rheinheimera texasensis TaxID=306205 RepID=UPI0032B2BB0F